MDPNERLKHVKSVLSQAPGKKEAEKRSVIPAGAQPTHQVLAFNINKFLPSNHYDLVYPRVYLGDFWLATDVKSLKGLKITHVVNTAQGTKFSQVNTDSEYYAPLGIEFYGMQGLMDVVRGDIGKYLRPAAEFIHNALENEGVVYVHCHQGISRSASTVIAYLILYKGYRLEDAILEIRKHRPIFPNDGFLKQLIKLENEVETEKEQNVQAETEQNAQTETEQNVQN